MRGQWERGEHIHKAPLTNTFTSYFQFHSFSVLLLRIYGTKRITVNNCAVCVLPKPPHPGNNSIKMQFPAPWPRAKSTQIKGHLYLIPTKMLHRPTAALVPGTVRICFHILPHLISTKVDVIPLFLGEILEAQQGSSTFPSSQG